MSNNDQIWNVAINAKPQCKHKQIQKFKFWGGFNGNLKNYDLLKIK